MLSAAGLVGKYKMSHLFYVQYGTQPWGVRHWLL
ncbi:hypothetical protein CCUS01_12457 [Colletotrichum cuscutae]|uniref:Uncharacterized protein n=1 Tax=Colletotrichum cuscutae TaxID=1209917 RepID=A0AAI9TU46_9PEZI|nr:hypothetical protein CCUS01_12457 [Colletotrichum cuscutae]